VFSLIFALLTEYRGGGQEEANDNRLRFFNILGFVHNIFWKYRVFWTYSSTLRSALTQNAGNNVFTLRVIFNHSQCITLIHTATYAILPISRDFRFLIIISTVVIFAISIQRINEHNNHYIVIVVQSILFIFRFVETC